MKEEKGGVDFSGKKRDSDALQALDSLTLSRSQKAEEGGVALRLLSAGKEWSAGWIQIPTGGSSSCWQRRTAKAMGN